MENAVRKHPIRKPADIDDVADYMITELKAAGNGRLTALRLNRLLYLAQAWHCGMYGVPLFDGAFEARKHGPVNAKILGRFKTPHSGVELGDRLSDGRDLDGDDSEFADILIRGYGTIPESELQGMLENEDLPYMEALKDGGKEISQERMAAFYGKRFEDLGFRNVIVVGGRYRVSDIADIEEVGRSLKCAWSETPDAVDYALLNLVKPLLGWGDDVLSLVDVCGDGDGTRMLELRDASDREVAYRCPIDLVVERLAEDGAAGLGVGEFKWMASAECFASGGGEDAAC